MRIVINASFLFSTLVLISCAKTKNITGIYGVVYDNSSHDTLQIEVFQDSFVVFSHHSTFFDNEYHVGFYNLKNDSTKHYTLVPSSITNNNIPLNFTELNNSHAGIKISFKELNPCFYWYLILCDTVIRISDETIHLDDTNRTIQVMGVYKKSAKFRYDTLMSEKRIIDCRGCEVLVEIDNRYYNMVHFMWPHKERLFFNKENSEITTTVSEHLMKRIRKRYFDWEDILYNGLKPD